MQLPFRSYPHLATSITWVGPAKDPIVSLAHSLASRLGCNGTTYRPRGRPQRGLACTLYQRLGNLVVDRQPPRGRCSAGGQWHEGRPLIRLRILRGCFSNSGPPFEPLVPRGSSRTSGWWGFVGRVVPRRLGAPRRTSDDAGKARTVTYMGSLCPLPILRACRDNAVHRRSRVRTPRPRGCGRNPPKAIVPLCR